MTTLAPLRPTVRQLTCPRCGGTTMEVPLVKAMLRVKRLLVLGYQRCEVTLDAPDAGVTRELTLEFPVACSELHEGMRIPITMHMPDPTRKSEA